jgi:DNA repair protein RecO (recombination protein O)
VALAHVAEMLDELTPDREANDSIFRLAWGVLQALEEGPIWIPVTYFDLWMVRLMGLLPPLDSCIECSALLYGKPAWFHAMRDGLHCVQHKRVASSEMSVASRELAERMFRAPVDAFIDEPLPPMRLADLRKFLMQVLLRHLDRKLETVVPMERLD